jgi:beta-glucosidase
VNNVLQTFCNIQKTKNFKEMKNLINVIMLLVLFTIISCDEGQEGQADYLDSSLTISERTSDLLSKMTIEEKVAQTTSYNEQEAVYDENGEFTDKIVKDFVKNGIGIMRFGRLLDQPPDTHTEITNAAQRYIIENNRFGIPTLYYGEALHGYMAEGATVFPSAIGLASTWDTELVQKIYEVSALEMRARGITVAFTPVLGLARDARWGRTGETFGEDPYLVSRMGVASVKGLQGESYFIDQQHVIATAKHYAVHSQPVGGTWCAPADFSERTIREQFLYPFEVAVKEAKVGCIMATYNEINGIPINADHKLMTRILRDEWGFDGFVCSDLTSVDQLFTRHFVAADTAEAARMAIQAGLDLENARDIFCYPTLTDQFEEGLIPEWVLDTAVTRILKAKFRLGLFENSYVDPENVSKVTNTEAHKALALETAHKSIILLKNENDLLPLNEKEIKNLAVIGPNAAELHFGAYAHEPRKGIHVLEGIQNYAKGKFKVHYAEGCKITVKPGSFWRNENPRLNSAESDAMLIKEAVGVASKCDAVVLVLGGNESTCREAWGFDTHKGDRANLDLIGRQDDLVKAVMATGKPVVVLLLNERPLTINYITENVPAILESWYLGQETGTAVADVLFGKINPGGKLPITFPKSVGQIPVFYNRKYTRFKSYLFLDSKPLFPFGFGLSYTTFEYNNLKIANPVIKPDQDTEVSIEVTNTGDLTGDEIVQLYIRDMLSSVTRPIMELKDFERITLDPGETKTVKLSITPEKLQFYDINMERVVEPGEFEVMIGSSSQDIRLRSVLSVE